MLSIQNTQDFRIESPTIITIGTFDGVHLGHQKILERLDQLKAETGLKTVVLTFDPHPRKVLFSDHRGLQILTPTDEKLELLEKYGVDVVAVYPFSKAFSQLPPIDYIQLILVKMMKVRHLVIGYDHKFGRDREGDIHVLKKHGEEFNFSVEEISAQDIDHIAISSSKIRKALLAGNIEMATSFLGHQYFLNATVIRGKQLGRELGYPTANLKPGSEDKLIPKTGIYFAEGTVNEKTYRGMMSIGTNPTTDLDQGIKLEIHLFDFDGDLYNQTIRVSFVKRLRDEVKFANLTELKLALENDKKNCLNLIADR